MSSEVQSRPAAARGGRGATRGGRGGFAGRGSTRRANGDAKNDDTSLASLEDEGEIGQLKKLYGAKTTLIREMFPDWSEVDILFALRETDGDENLTVTRIAEGTISQWDEVSKPKKERAKAKANAPAAADASARPARRDGAGLDKTRGRANARATERGGRSARGRSAQPAAANGTRAEAPLSVPTEESQAFDGQKTADEEPAAAAATASAAAPTTSTPSTSSAPAASAPKTWASMLRQTVAPLAKPIQKIKEAVPSNKPEDSDSHPPSSTSASVPAPTSTDDSETAPTADAVEPAPAAKDAAAPDVAVPAAAVAVPEVVVAPSTDALTESNLERVDDISHPPDTDTIRSETADSWDPRSAAPPGISTPISASHQQHAAKALGSGYAATASKATGADRTAVRTPSYSRRVLDQEEAVRMPVNRDVDRAAVQFGALSFNGADNEDIDGDREEPETRTQPPDDSPVAHPRASLPPVAPPAASVPDAFGAQKQAAPAAVAASAATPTASSTLPSAPAAAAPVAAPTGPAAQTAAAQNTQPYGRYGQDASSFGQKPFDAYGQPNQAQVSANSQYDSYNQGIPTASQAQQAPAAYSSAPGEYSQYFTSDAQSRMPQQYNNYYQTYGQQAAQGHQDGAQNQRPYGGYDSLSQYPQSSGASRFGAGAGAAAASNVAADAQNSGSTTPNPPVAGQPQQQQQGGAQGQHGQQGQQQHQASQYQSYNHPYYTNPYYSQYMNQYNAFGAQNSYNAPYGGKGGYGGSHHPYGMTPQNPYDHNASQVSGGGFGGASSLHRGAGGAESSGLGSAGLSDYGRVGAAGQAAPGFGGDNSYGRGGASSYQSQAGQGYGAQQSQVGSQQTGADDLKPYGDASKGAAGANPSLARPGSATNTQSAQSSGLPPPQSSQQGGYGGYPSHLQQHGAGGLHGNNQSAAGGAGGYGNQNHGNNPYGSYGQHGQGFGGSNNYYNNQQQQRGGWGGNYH
ncbi:RNAPII degradation factor [Sporothrix curviconia]|uniref:RNA polymerase II degradation factor 1 n=1 Tax=Sporothrix curviconia TaxID=1260050 RepID=A0ABP0C056_9PEZI